VLSVHHLAGVVVVVILLEIFKRKFFVSFVVVLSFMRFFLELLTIWNVLVSSEGFGIELSESPMKFCLLNFSKLFEFSRNLEYD
jgi:hypothetical protein